MDFYPLLNSLRVALIATLIVFFLGIFAAFYIAKLSRVTKALLDVVLTLPLVLPPTVVGYLLLLLLGPNSILGEFLGRFGVRFVMNWQAIVIACVVVSFPLMYRTVRGAFESFDESLADAAKTLGLSNAFIFWRIRLAYCKNGLLAATVLAFARALGEYGATSMVAGFTPGVTATISTSVYHFWRVNDEASAAFWVVINIVISVAVLLVLNGFEKRGKNAKS